MTDVTLQTLAEHAPIQDTVVLEVGHLSLVLSWEAEGWRLDSGFSAAPHAVGPSVLLRFLHERVGTVIPASLFARLARKQAA